MKKEKRFSTFNQTMKYEPDIKMGKTIEILTREAGVDVW